MTGTATNKKFNRPPSLRRPPVEKGRWASKGTKPLPEQASIQHIMSIMVIHICRKVLFIETRVKITLYSFSLFFGSLIFDFLPIPRTYLAIRDNIFNTYFVKIGWAWLLFIVGSFVYLTSATYGCGKTAIIQQHMGRLVVGTVVWYMMTQWIFGSIEAATGTCLGKAILADKYSCVTSGHQWHAFDISGHAFLLVYMNLVTVEEAQAIVGWETLRETIFHEDHHRVSTTGHDAAPPSSPSEQSSYYACPDPSSPSPHTEGDAPLRSLPQKEYTTFRDSYTRYTPYIRVLFVLMTSLSVACDVMLAVTVVYFHTMPQKVVGGAIGMMAWYATYRCVFKGQWPGLPGEGAPVRYQTHRPPVNRERLKKKPVITTKDNHPVPMFMGMPLYSAVKKEDRTTSKDTKVVSTDDSDDRQASTTDEGEKTWQRRSRFPAGNVWR